MKLLVTKKLSNVTDLVNNIPELGKGNYPWSEKVIPAWENDITQLNEDNLNALSEGITNLRDRLKNFGIDSKLVIDAIVKGNAGWKSDYEDTGEVFNDYNSNHAVGGYSHSEGSLTISGMRGYWVGAISQNESGGTIWLTNSDKDESNPAVDVVPKVLIDPEGQVSVTGPTCGYSVIEGAENGENEFFCIVTGNTYSKVIVGNLTGVTGNQLTYTSNDVINTPLNDDEKESLRAKIFMHRFPNPTGYNVYSGSCAHSEGLKSHAVGDATHSEGKYTHAIGDFSHSEGSSTLAVGVASHSEGGETRALGRYSHAEGVNSISYGVASHAEGIHTVATCDYQHVQGKFNSIDVNNQYAHIIGNGSSSDNRANIHTVDWFGNAWYSGNIEAYLDVIAHNGDTTATLMTVHNDLSTEIEDREDGDKKLLGGVEDGYDALTIYGTRSYAKKLETGLIDTYITGSWETGKSLVTLGDVLSWINLQNPFESFDSIISEKLDSTEAVGRKYTEYNTKGTGEVFNDYTKNTAHGEFAHAEGTGTRAWEVASHTEGLLTEALVTGQHVQGRANILDKAKLYAHIVGNGVVNYDESTKSYTVEEGKRSNAHTIDWEGNAWFAGGIYLGGSGQYDTNARRLPMIYTGTGEPNDNIGVDGDIYIKYDPVATIELLEDE